MARIVNYDSLSPMAKRKVQQAGYTPDEGGKTATRRSSKQSFEVKETVQAAPRDFTQEQMKGSSAGQVKQDTAQTVKRQFEQGQITPEEAAYRLNALKQQDKSRKNPTKNVKVQYKDRGEMTIKEAANELYRLKEYDKTKTRQEQAKKSVKAKGAYNRAEQKVTQVTKPIINKLFDLDSQQYTEQAKKNELYMFTQGFIKGGIKEIRDKPVKEGAIYAISAGTAPILRGLSKLPGGKKVIKGGMALGTVVWGAVTAKDIVDQPNAYSGGERSGQAFVEWKAVEYGLRTGGGATSQSNIIRETTGFDKQPGSKSEGAKWKYQKVRDGRNTIETTTKTDPRTGRTTIDTRTTTEPIKPFKQRFNEALSNTKNNYKKMGEWGSKQKSKYQEYRQRNAEQRARRAEEANRKRQELMERKNRAVERYKDQPQGRKRPPARPPAVVNNDIVKFKQPPNKNELTPYKGKDLVNTKGKDLVKTGGDIVDTGKGGKGKGEITPYEPPRPEIYRRDYYTEKIKETRFKETRVIEQGGWGGGFGIPAVPLINFGAGGGLLRGFPSYKKGRKGKQKGYLPSQAAITFNIKGKKPGRTTGLELRPVLK